MLEVRDHYHELSMNSYSESFLCVLSPVMHTPLPAHLPIKHMLHTTFHTSVCRNAFQCDDYTPLVVDTEEKYQGVLDVFPYRNVDLERKPFPKQFPFSASVHIVYTLLREFVDGAISYDQGLNIRCVRRTKRIVLPA